MSLSQTSRRAAAYAAVSLIALAGVACGGNDDPCGTTVCDQQGQPLIYAPWIVPAYGTFGYPGYVAPVTIYPGAPNYHTTYVNHPPNYTPPVAPKPPAPNPGNAKPTAPVKAPAPPGYRAPSVKVNAPSVKAPSLAPARPPSVKSGK